MHPIHTEAVTSIAGRAELLAAAFLFIAWTFHLKNRHILAVLCFALALLSKESAIVFLPLILISDHVLGRWKPKSHYLRIAAVSLLYLGVLWKLDGGRFGPADIQMLDNPLANLPILWRILNALRVAWKYVALQFYPAVLSCDYSFNQIPIYLDWRHTLPAALAAFAALACWVNAVWRKHRVSAIGGATYFAGFAVTANLLMPIGTIMAERLAYVPSAGFCLLIAGIWGWLYGRHQRFAVCVLILAVAALGVRTVTRNRDWKDNLTLWSADALAVPNSARIHVMLGSAYVDTAQFDRALPELETALKIDPDLPEAMEAYGLLQSWKGNYQIAGAMLERAFYSVHRGYPNYDGMAVNLAVLYMQTDHLEGALQILNREIGESPQYARAWATRALIHHKRGELTAAREDAEMAIRLDPSNPDAQRILALFHNSGQPIVANSVR